MRTFKKWVGLALPLAGTLAATSFAAADSVVSYMEASGVGSEQTVRDCDFLSTQNSRGALMAEATGENTSFRPLTARTYQTGTSMGSTEPNGTGTRHRAKLYSEAIDWPAGTARLKEHCTSAWSPGYITSGTTNMMSCSASVRTSLSATGSCSNRTITAYSMGTDAD